VLNFDLTPDEFRAECFEQKPRHFRGALVDRPIAWSDIDRLLHFLTPGLPVMRMFHQGQVPDHSYTQEYTELGRTRRRLDKARFYEYLGSGATLQINWLEQHLIPAKRLCLEVGRFAGTPTSGNAYMSFSGAGSFGKHWDTHDVFVIQLIGRKRWQIYSPTFPLPLTYQTNDRSGHTCPEEPAVDLVLEEGDVMYVPRGWWHHVVPLDIGSFHLSVGSYPPNLFDYIVQTSAKYLEQQVGARRSFSTASYRQAVTELLQQLPAVLLDPANAASFERDWASRERMDAEFTLAALDSVASRLPGDAILSLTTCRSPALEDGTLLVNGKQLGLDAVNQAIVAALRNVAHLSFDEICARLPDTARDVLQGAVLDLARHDIVTIQPQ
jgi:ribosomal protein L16 Arg81 hydroxylase